MSEKGKRLICAVKALNFYLHYPGLDNNQQLKAVAGMVLIKTLIVRKHLSAGDTRTLPPG